MSSEESDFFDQLILNGSIEVVGIDEDTGDFMYNITTKMKDFLPELYDEHLNKIDSDIKELWNDGFLEINLLEDNPMVYLSAKSFIDYEVDQLSEDKKQTLKEIKRLLEYPNSGTIDM